MNTTLSKALTFMAGAVVGSVVTWKLVEARYSQIAREEVEAVRELYREKYGDEDDDDSESEPITDARSLLDNVEYQQLLKREGYTNYSGGPGNEEGTGVKKPYVISPDEFGSDENYGTETLYYYDDGVLTDDVNNPIEDVAGMVGDESLTTFGQYEDDAVYVRNERYMTDYEILADARKFADVVKSEPHSTEV